MARKLLKFTILIPALIILITIVIIHARIYYHPEIRIAGQDTVNTDVLKELRGLKSALDNNADVEMQKIYPEGYLFINALYGLAWCMTNFFSPEYGDLIKDWISNVKSNLDTRGLIPHSINSVTRQIKPIFF